MLQKQLSTETNSFFEKSVLNVYGRVVNASGGIILKKLLNSVVVGAPDAGDDLDSEVASSG